MEIIFGIIILFILWIVLLFVLAVIPYIGSLIGELFKKLFGSSKRPPENPVVTRTSNTYRPSSSIDNSVVKEKPSTNIYRPSSSTSGQTRKISFKTSNSFSEQAADLDLKDLVDALTGAPLQLELGLYQCQRCKVFYQAQSYHVIQVENDGKCVSCFRKEIINVAGRQDYRGANADVSVITLDRYRDYVGSIITFEGYVYNVLTSRRGIDYAVMFENRSWSNGLKMVIFPECLKSVGGYEFLSSLAGRVVRVRGLLKLHEKYGYQIIVSDRAMILGVS
jgi:hypothetical protein